MKNSICDKTQEALAGYLDGENAALQNPEVQAHLAACEDCQAIYAEVQHALTTGTIDESSLAFPQNGAVRPRPDAQYWNHLPDRVMARIDAMKGASPHRLVPPTKRLRDARLVKFFAASKLRPTLALATVVALVFVITRTMQESLPGSESLKTLPDAPMAAAESGPVAVQDESGAQRSAPAEEESREKKISTDAAKPRMSESKPALQPAEAPMTTAERAVSRSEQITPPVSQMTLSGEKRKDTDAQSANVDDEAKLVLDEPAKTEQPSSIEPAPPVLAKEAIGEQERSRVGETAGAAAGMSQQIISQRAGSFKLQVASQAPASTSESSYSQALWRAQQAATPKAQQIIWQDFLSAASDSTYIKLAIAQLAQSMLAQVDSNSSAEQLKSTLRFLEQHEAVLRSQLGGEKLGNEMRRVRLLQEQKNKP